MKPFFSALFILCFLWMPGIAQNWQTFDQQVKQKKDFQNQPVIVLLDSTSVQVADNGSGTFTIRKIIKVGTPQGALKNRVLKYDYDPLTAFAEFKTVTVYRPDGSIKNIDPKTAQDYAAPARAIYWGARQIMIELGQLEPGSVIDYEIAKKGFTYALLGSADEDRFVPAYAGTIL